MHKGKSQHFGKQNRVSKVFIYGKHALAEALAHAPQVLKKIYLAESVGDAALRARIAQQRIPTAALKEGALREVASGASHQGIVAEVSTEHLLKPYAAFREELAPDPRTLLVLIDELTDPQNVGAIIRSAAAFGAAAVLMPEHNQAPITGAVVKVSAGMAFRIPLVRIGNVNQTVRDLKERGFWVYGLTGDGAHALQSEQFSKPSVLIVGNEAHGIREKTREHCDTLLKIPIAARTESLNAAAAASVALYAWSVQHPPVFS